MSQAKTMSPFDLPKMNEFFGALVSGLISESDRGAVLVGATYLDNHLDKLIKDGLPADMKKEERECLMKYPGPVSSFAARQAAV